MGQPVTNVMVTLDLAPPFAERETWGLTDEQADGRACVICTQTDRPMTPIGTAAGVQIFAHGECIERVAGLRRGQRARDNEVFSDG